MGLSLSQIVRAELKRRGRTVGWLADQLDVSEQNLRNRLSGTDTGLTGRYVMTIDAVLGLRLDYGRAVFGAEDVLAMAPHVATLTPTGDVTGDMVVPTQEVVAGG